MSRRRMRLNDTLVTAEVALSLVLVLSAGLLLKSLWRLSSVDPGFEADRILSMRLMLPARYDGGEERRILFDEVLERMEALPSVDRAAAVNWLPLFGGSSGIPYRVAGQGLEEGTPSIVGSFKVVSPGFFEIMDMPAIEGRLVEEGAAAGEGEGVWDLVINEAMRRRHWPSESPIGAQIVSASDGDPLARVVGVVKDIRQEELNETSAPEFYLLGSQAGYAYRYVLIRTADDPSSLAESATAIVHEVAPDVPIRNVQTMREVVDGELTSSRFYLWLFGGFAVLALALGMVGVYGVMAYTVSQRAREVGVRLVLGAHRSKVVVSTMRSAMGPVVLGIAVGLPLAALASRLLTSFLFEVEPTDPWVFGVVAALLAVSGLVASAVPAWRASRLDPAGALREV